MATIVIGGGLSGLCAAALLARSGEPVTVLERADHLGGRAASQRQGGTMLNQGPHALYLGGPAARVLAELGVRFRGRPPRGGQLLERAGALAPLPATLPSLLWSRALSARGKLELLGVLLRARRHAARAGDDESVASWASARVLDEGARAMVLALVRLATYSAELERLSARAALSQLAQALFPGVLYVDGGWQSLVDGAEAAARAASVAIEPAAAAVAVAAREGRVEVTTADGQRRLADAVVLAVSPATCRSLLPLSQVVGDASARAQPLRAACLDVVLSSLPRPRHRFVLALDRPLYLSLHSASARLCPPGHHLVQLARYLRPGEDGHAARGELEELLERVQPGWRACQVYARFLPSMTVAHDLPCADRGGLAARAPLHVSDAPGVFLAGDWVGSQGLLLDAALGSAASTARAVLTARAAAAAAPPRLRPVA